MFDEIDTGIGGRAAEAVGKKLKELSRTHQIICVTHLPQIATFADHHYLISKKEVSGRTRTISHRDQRRGTHGRDRANAERREIDGYLSEARGANDQSQRVACSPLPASKHSQ